MAPGQPDPAEGQQTDALPPEDDPAILAVLPDEVGAAEVVGLGPEQLSEMVAGLQGQLAGTAKTGIPQIDAALERLADIDPQDLAGSAEVLADVLQRLEAAMGEGSAGTDPAGS